LVYLIIPQLAKKIGELYSRRQEYADAVQAYIRDFEIRHPEIYQYVGDSLNMVTGDISSWVNRLLPTISNYLTSILESAYVILRGVYNLIIGIVVSVYVLSDLEHFTASVRRWTYSVFKVEFAEKLREAIAFTDRTFMGFITGKLLDSAIIGLLCYIVCASLNMPYALLVSAIVGVTNVIPFFGPFIGAVPCAFIILMVDPLKCLIFIIFIIILQQIDGNIIGPKILGESVGLSPLWILFSILVFGGFFGFKGMLLGVPVFTCFYTLMRRLIRDALAKKDLPTETDDYDKLERIDPETKEIVRTERKKKKRNPTERGGLFRKKKAAEPPAENGQDTEKKSE
jgi:predicted PurR-regulated permease PerM